MAFSFIQVNGADPGTSTSVNHYDLASMNVAAGSLLVGFVKWENTATPISSITNSGAAQTWILGTVQNNQIVGLHGQFFWCLSTLANPTLVITVNWATATANWGRYRVVEYSTSSPVVDVEVPGANQPSGGPTANAVSGTFSTAQSVELVLGGAAFDNSEDFSLTPPTIGGVTATIRGASSSDTVLFTNITSSIISSGTVAATGNTIAHWSINGVAFKENRILAAASGSLGITGTSTTLRLGSTTYLRYRR